MCVNEGSVHVEVFTFHFYEVSLVSPVERLDVALSRRYEALPFEFLLCVDLPTLSVHIFAGLSEESGVMHHFLGDAADVHTSATKTPLGASRGGLDKVG